MHRPTQQSGSVDGIQEDPLAALFESFVTEHSAGVAEENASLEEEIRSVDAKIAEAQDMIQRIEKSRLAVSRDVVGAFERDFVSEEGRSEALAGALALLEGKFSQIDDLGERMKHLGAEKVAEFKERALQQVRGELEQALVVLREEALKAKRMELAQLNEKKGSVQASIIAVKNAIVGMPEPVELAPKSLELKKAIFVRKLSKKVLESIYGGDAYAELTDGGKKASILSALYDQNSHGSVANLVHKLGTGAEAWSRAKTTLDSKKSDRNSYFEAEELEKALTYVEEEFKKREYMEKVLVPKLMDEFLERFEAAHGEAGMKELVERNWSDRLRGVLEKDRGDTTLIGSSQFVGQGEGPKGLYYSDDMERDYYKEVYRVLAVLDEFASAGRKSLYRNSQFYNFDIYALLASADEGYLKRVLGEEDAVLDLSERKDGVVNLDLALNETSINDVSRKLADYCRGRELERVEPDLHLTMQIMRKLAAGYKTKGPGFEYRSNRLEMETGGLRTSPEGYMAVDVDAATDYVRNYRAELARYEQMAGEEPAVLTFADLQKEMTRVRREAASKVVTVNGQLEAVKGQIDAALNDKKAADVAKGGVEEEVQSLQERLVQLSRERAEAINRATAGEIAAEINLANLQRKHDELKAVVRSVIQALEEEATEIEERRALTPGAKSKRAAEAADVRERAARLKEHID